jgi:hypothetical protein
VGAGVGAAAALALSPPAAVGEDPPPGICPAGDAPADESPRVAGSVEARTLSGSVPARSAESAVVWAPAPAVAVRTRAMRPVVTRVLRKKAVEVVMGIPVL